MKKQILPLLMFITSCSAFQPPNDESTMYKVVSIEKYEDYSVVLLEQNRLVYRCTNTNEKLGMRYIEKGSCYYFDLQLVAEADSIWGGSDSTLVHHIPPYPNYWYSGSDTVWVTKEIPWLHEASFIR